LPASKALCTMRSSCQRGGIGRHRGWTACLKKM